jgi:leucyl aminopeptidase
VRRAGATIGAALAEAGEAVHVLMDRRAHAPELALGLALRAYVFDAHKTAERPAPPAVAILVADPAAADAAAAPHRARAEGVAWTRDLVNEPANILTTDSFTERLRGLSDLGVRVEVLEEDDLRALGMGALLGVGQGSDAPSRVVVMEWRGPGAPDGPPLALVGKGVMFDTGGVSIKPAGGMEEMTMDMGGAGVVAGVMRTLARRGAAAHVVGLVGLVENMVSGRAQRPGDVVRSMKGDTIEVINTDAEGRLVLADVMWYAQDRFKPAAMIDLATLTGAVIVALGQGHAGLFSNDDALCAALARAAAAESEDTWRLPLGEEFDRALKSRIADMKNVGGRPGGASIAAQFLHRFVAPGLPWVHVDIAGVALRKEDTRFAPKGATGWGVLALDRLVRDRFEG